MRKNYFQLSKVSKLMRKISPIFLLCTCLTLGLTSCDSNDDPKEKLVEPNEFVQVISGNTFEIGGQQVDINQVIADADADAKAHAPVNYAQTNGSNQVIANYVLDHNPCTKAYTLKEMNGSYSVFKAGDNELIIFYIYEGHAYVYEYAKSNDTWMNVNSMNKSAMIRPTEIYIMDITITQLEDNSVDLIMGYPTSQREAYIQQIMNAEQMTYEQAFALYESRMTHMNMNVYYTNKSTHSFVFCKHFSTPDADDREIYNISENAAYANDFWVVSFTFG